MTSKCEHCYKTFQKGSQSSKALYYDFNFCPACDKQLFGENSSEEDNTSGTCTDNDSKLSRSSGCSDGPYQDHNHENGDQRYESILRILDERKEDVENLKNKLKSIIFSLEDASETYRHEHSCDFVELRQLVSNHFQDARRKLKEDEEKAMKKLAKFQMATVEKCEKQTRIYREKLEKLQEIEEISKLRKEEVLEKFGDLNFKLLDDVKVPKANQTMLFELKLEEYKNIDFEIFVTKKPFIRTTFFDSSSEDLIHKSILSENKLSGNRYLFRNYVMNEINNLDTLRESQVFFIMPNKYPNDQLEKLEKLLEIKNVVKTNLLVIVKAVTSDETINEQLASWLAGKDVKYSFLLFEREIISNCADFQKIRRCSKKSQRLQFG